MKGILFKPDMIKAIQENRKTVTRRLDHLKSINEYPNEWIFKRYLGDGGDNKYWFQHPQCERYNYLYNAYIKSGYKVGEVVYIKEAWHYLNIEENKATPYDFGIEFADGEILWWTDNGEEMNYPLDEKRRSPMFLKAKFARYFIRIKDVRTERLQEITEEDCYKEGCLRVYKDEAIQWYQVLWDSINPKSKWASNPFVWVYTFQKVDK